MKIQTTMSNVKFVVVDDDDDDNDDDDVRHLKHVYIYKKTGGQTDGYTDTSTLPRNALSCTICNFLPLQISPSSEFSRSSTHQLLFCVKIQNLRNESRNSLLFQRLMNMVIQ